MIYKMTLKDSTDEMTFNLLEVPIVDKDIEGAVDNVTLDGNQYTDYLYLKKQYIQKWSIMCDEEYERLRGFYTRQFDEAEIPTYELYYGETIYNEYTRSGDYILVDVQGVEPARMSLAQLNGNATQTTYSGKNLWDGVFGQGRASTASAYHITSTQSPLLESGTTYTVSLSSVPSGMKYAVALYTNPAYPESHPGASIYDSGWQTDTSFTFTAGGNYYFSVVMSKIDGSAVTPSAVSDVNFQLEVGSTATSYEPYVGGIPAPNPSYPQPISVVTGENVVKIQVSGGTQDFPIDLGTTELAKIGTYRDRIYKEGEKWYIEEQVGKVTLTGDTTTETWGSLSLNSHGLGVIQYTSANNPVTGGSGVGISDHFPYYWSYNSPKPCFYSMTQGNTGGFAFVVSQTTKQTFLTWLASNPTTVYYALATPTTTEITNQTLIDQLEALINVSISTGIHNIFTEVASGNLNPTIVLNFIEVVSRRVELVPETPVRLTLTDGGIINACGCRKDVQLTMRETIE